MCEIKQCINNTNMKNAKSFGRVHRYCTPTPQNKITFGIGPVNAKWGDYPNTTYISYLKIYYLCI